LLDGEEIGLLRVLLWEKKNGALSYGCWHEGNKGDDGLI